MNAKRILQPAANITCVIIAGLSQLTENWFPGPDWGMFWPWAHFNSISRFFRGREPLGPADIS